VPPGITQASPGDPEQSTSPGQLVEIEAIAVTPAR
jgi:hypothetical protein